MEHLTIMTLAGLLDKRPARYTSPSKESIKRATTLFKRARPERLTGHSGLLEAFHIWFQLADTSELIRVMIDEPFDFTLTKRKIEQYTKATSMTKHARKFIEPNAELMSYASLLTKYTSIEYNMYSLKLRSGVNWRPLINDSAFVFSVFHERVTRTKQNLRNRDDMDLTIALCLSLNASSCHKVLTLPYIQPTFSLRTRDYALLEEYASLVKIENELDVFISNYTRKGNFDSVYRVFSSKVICEKSLRLVNDVYGDTSETSRDKFINVLHARKNIGYGNVERFESSEEWTKMTAIAEFFLSKGITVRIQRIRR